MRTFVTAVSSLALLLAAVVPAAADADPLSEPIARDQVAERCGIDPDLMRLADLTLLANPYVVLRHGQLCWRGGHPVGHAVPLPVFSVTKTFGAVLVGAVAARSSLDDTTPLTDWLDPDELGAVNPDATVAHVLSMAGTNTDLSAGQRDPWTYDTFGSREIDLLVEVVDRVIAAEPDGFDGAADSVEFAQQSIFDVLGMRDTSWPGGSIGAGMVSTPIDMARLGELLLRRGRWGEVEVLDERFAYRMTHPAFEDANTAFGYLTYLNAADNRAYSSGTADDRCSPYTTWPSYPHAPFFEQTDPGGGTPFTTPAPHDIGLVWAAGAGGQRVSIHRGLDLVIAVRDTVLPTDPRDPGIFEGHKSVWTAIRPALVALDETFAGDEEAFCEAYRRSEHAPTLRDPWSVTASTAARPEAPDGSSSAGDGPAVDPVIDPGDDADDDTAPARPGDTPSSGPDDAIQRVDAGAPSPLPVTGGGVGVGLLLLGAAWATRRR